MRLILVTGGARSGKSHYAERRALALGGDAVTYLATATAEDAEMAARITRHRTARNARWRTIEAPSGVGRALEMATTDVVLLDCITLLASNVMLSDVVHSERQDAAEAAVESELDALFAAMARREGTLVAVTNEVGLGVVPHTTMGRWYRDILGAANRRLAAAAAEVVLMISGIPLALKKAN